MIGKPIESYSDYLYYVNSDRWYLSMSRISEFKEKNPQKYEEYRKRLESEQTKGRSLGYRVEMRR